MIGDLSPVHAVRQANVGDEQLDAGAGLQDLQPGRPIGRADHRVAQLVEHLVDQMSDRCFVIDDQDCLSACILGRDTPTVQLLRLRIPVMARQVDADGRALADLGIDPDLPPGLTSEAVDHRQAKARALTDAAWS